MADDTRTMASFDADTQAKATDALQQFTAIYHVSANAIHAEELGAAIQAGLDASGNDASSEAFQKKLYDELLHAVYYRMAEAAEQGREGPPGASATLRRSLIQKYGALPTAVKPHSRYTYSVTVDARTFDVVVPGPKVAADEDVTSGPLGTGDDMVKCLIASSARGELTITETTSGRAAMSGEDFDKLLSNAVDASVTGPTAVK